MNGQEKIKKQIITLFIKNGFLISPPLMRRLLQEKNPLDMASSILEKIKAKSASIAIVTLEDASFDDSFIVQNERVQSQEHGINVKGKDEDKMTSSTLSSLSDQPAFSHEPTEEKRVIWKFRTFNWMEYEEKELKAFFDLSSRLEALKEHEFMVVKEYRHLLSSQAHLSNETIEVGIILEKHPFGEETELLMSFPTKKVTKRIKANKSQLTPSDWELLDELPINSIIGTRITHENQETEIIINIIRPFASNSSSTPQDATGIINFRIGKHIKNGGLLIVGGINPWNASLYTLKQLFKFLKGEITLQSVDNKRNDIISIDEVDLILLLAFNSTTSKRKNLMKAELISRNEQQKRMNILVEKIDSLTPSRIHIIWQVVDLFWPPNVIPAPPFTHPTLNRLSRRVKFLSTPGKIELLLDETFTEKKNEPREEQAKKSWLSLLSYMEPYPETTPRLARLMIKLRHLHVFSPNLTHLPPRDHRHCILDPMPDLFIHNLGSRSYHEKVMQTTIICASRPEIFFHVDPQSKKITRFTFSDVNEEK